jgi:hypothetical protein
MAKVLLSVSVDSEVKKEIEKRNKKNKRGLSYNANELLIIGISKNKSKEVDNVHA